jgi:hypothetical protein
MEREALDARTAIRLASLRAQKDEERAIQERAVELEKEMATRAEGRRRAEETGGRRTNPTQGCAHIHRRAFSAPRCH